MQKGMHLCQNLNNFATRDKISMSRSIDYADQTTISCAII